MLPESRRYGSFQGFCSVRDVLPVRHRLHGDNTRDCFLFLFFSSIWSTAKDRAEKKRQKGAQPKGSGEATRSQPRAEDGVTQPPPPAPKSSQRTPASSERESLGKEKPTKDSLRRGERGFRHVLLLLSHCFFNDC